MSGPAAPAPSPATIPQLAGTSELEQLGTVRLLIVEDDEYQLLELCRLFKQANDLNHPQVTFDVRSAHRTGSNEAGGG